MNRKTFIPAFIAMLSLTSCNVTEKIYKDQEVANAFYIGTYPTALVTNEVYDSDDTESWNVYLYLSFIGSQSSSAVTDFDVEFCVSDGTELEGTSANEDGVYPRYLNLSDRIVDGKKLDDFFSSGGIALVYESIGRITDDNRILSSASTIAQNGCYSFSVISEESETLIYRRTSVTEKVIDIGGLFE